MQNVAETQETVPSHPAGASTLTGEENLMAGQTLPVAEALLVPPGPVTVTVSLNCCADAPPSAGNVTGTESRAGEAPAAQAVVTGSPVTAGVAETVHFADRVTIADRTVAPPAAGSSAGATVTWVIAGGASRTTTVTDFATALPPRR